MINIRLQRRGRKNDPSFRLIVVDSKKKPKTGNYLEMVGSYDPRLNRVDLKADRIKHWLQNGAKASDTVHNILVSNKVIDAKKINVLPKFVAPVVVAEAAPAVAEAPIETPVEAAVEEALVEVAEETPAEVAATEDNSVASEESAS